MPPFAATDEGQTILALHRTGTPLATTLPGLTWSQHEFLVAALVEQDRRERAALRQRPG